MITSDDLADPSIDRRVKEMTEARAPQMIRNVGQPQAGASGGRAKFGRTMVTMALLGLAGGFVGFVVSEVIGGGDDGRVENLTQSTMLFTSLFTAALGAVLISWDGIEARNSTKALKALGRGLPVVVAGGALGGAIAQQLYSSFVESAAERALTEADSEAEFLEMMTNAVRFPRALAFLLVGACIGAALGVVYKSVKRGQNGVIGGAVGGFIGGGLFDWVGEASDSGTISRAVALTITGTLIGLAVGAVDVLRKESWLHIVSGGMAGKQFILFRDTCTIGSSGEADVTLIKDPSIASVHVELKLIPGDGADFRSLAPHLPVALNGVPTDSGRLGDGSLLQIGKTVLQFGTKSVEMPALQVS